MAGGANESTNDGLIVLIAAAAVIGVLWYFWGTQISWGYVLTKKVEYYWLKITLMDKLFPETWALKVGPYEAALAGEAPIPRKAGQLAALGAGVGFFFRWHMVLAMSYAGYLVLKRNPLQKFRRAHSMKTLVESEQQLWPAIAPVANLNLIKESVDKGPWAMSRKPLDFARYYKLLDEGNKLNRDRAEKLFAVQLGKLWEGSGKLPPYARALFAAFAAQACGDLEAAKDGLNKLSMSMAAKQPDYSWVNDLLKKYEKNDAVQSVVKRHAYVYTVMASMLKQARGFGVLASSQFIWLRPLNRQLWYTLNGVGRRVAFAEVAGIYAHWIAEDVAEHPIERPYVIKAVDGLERALLEVKFD